MADWWKKSVVYQVYPRSFMDANGDGVGDLKGITQKLPYIRDLGADVVWLSPINQSGGVDAGYDISDYYQIEPEFGTMADFNELLQRAHELGLKIVMDLVVNHTSDKHPWFQESRSSRHSAKRDYYIWRNGFQGSAPNRMMGYFCEPAWEYDAKTDQYYMHLFAIGQPDLNWENEAVRREVYAMMNFWFMKGIDGFRLDVINAISKPPAAVASDGGKGANCENGPRVHEYLREMNRETFLKYDCITVGETPGVSVGDAIRYAGVCSNELNMIFQFELMDVDQDIYGKWTSKRYDLRDVKRVVTRWQEGLYGKAWNSQYLGNHDQPRCVSRFGDTSTPEYREKSAKMLATFLHMLQGTPYIYQGDELGMTNTVFKDMSDVRDVEAFNAYRLYVEQRKVFTHNEMMRFINLRGRDNARTPMQWSGETGAGFTRAEPWIGINPNHTQINAKAQVNDPNSVYGYYKRLIRLRREYDIITNGEYKLIDKDNPCVYTYTRVACGETLLVLCNFSAVAQSAAHAEALVKLRRATRLIGNYPPETAAADILRPYEARVYLLE
ncbi:MAG: alpha-glucosidase [Clostridiales bacterium]|nr:alpha-glucosidase [Clostridiales bacterium]